MHHLKQMAKEGEVVEGEVVEEVELHLLVVSWRLVL